MTHYIWFYDIEVTFWTNGWLRKSFGILSLIAVTGMAFYLVFFKSKSEDYSPPNLPHWSPYMLLAVTLWQPDSRLSPVLLVFCVTMIIYLRKSKTPQKNRLNSFELFLPHRTSSHHGGASVYNSILLCSFFEAHCRARRSFGLLSIGRTTI